MATVMVSLLGGRPTPNMVATLHLRPDILYLVASEDAFGTGGNCEKLVNALPSRLRPSCSYSVKPYNLDETIEYCKDIADKHRNDHVIIMSGSEPKTMGFGAYDAVKTLRAQGRNVDMCCLSREGLVWVFRTPTMVESVRIGLKDYFAGYGWSVKSRPNQMHHRFQQLVPLIVQNLPTSHRLLCTLRSNNRGVGRRTIECNSRLGDSEFSILQEIEQLGILSNVERTVSSTRWTVNSDDDGRFLLSGDWLEFYVYQIASQSSMAHDAPLFDECGWGVEDQSGKGEIDFAGIIGGQMVIASCKTEDNIRRTWFEELHSKTEQLGKGMCSSLMVSSVPRDSRDATQLAEYKKWAQERHITLVMAEDVPQMSCILTKIVTGDKDAEPRHIPCYARI